MAVITPSALISEIRGSVGAQTFSRNRYGAYVKAKLIQTNPNTVPQQGVRAELADAIAEWQALSQANQDKWIDYAATNIIGKNISRKIKRAGYNEYVSRCMNRFAVSGAGTGFQPLPKVRLFPIITSVTTAATNITINFDTQKPIGTCDLIIYATPPISPGINEINPSLYRIIGVVTPAAQLSSTNIYTLYNTMFPLTGADIGKKIGVAIKAVNTDNFAPGQFFFAQTTISGGLVSGAPIFVQSNISNWITSNSPSITIPSPIQSGNLIILSVGTEANVTITPPTGFTLVRRTTTSNRGPATYRKIATGSEPASYTFTFSGSTNTQVTFHEFSNVNAVTPISYILENSAANTGNFSLTASYTSVANTIDFISLYVFQSCGPAIFTPSWPYKTAAFRGPLQNHYKYFFSILAGQSAFATLPGWPFATVNAHMLRIFGA